MNVDRVVDGEAIRARREQLYGPRSRERFCRLHNFAPSSIKALENGQHQPWPRTALALAAALDWTVDDLYRPANDDTDATDGQEAA